MNKKTFINFVFLCIVFLFESLSASKLPSWIDPDYADLKMDMSTKSFLEKRKILMSMHRQKRYMDVIDLFRDTLHDRFGESVEEGRFRVARSIVLSKAYQEQALDVSISPYLVHFKLKDALFTLSEYVQFDIKTGFAQRHPHHAMLYSFLINAGYAEVFDMQLSLVLQRFRMNKKIDWQKFFDVWGLMNHHTALAAEQCKNYERLCELDAEREMNLSIMQNAKHSIKFLSERVKAFSFVLLSNVRIAQNPQ
ncbi:MAG: hypothetical protein ACTHJ4_07445 [Candidatus Nucleicultricaceae bacterium]